MLTLSSTETAVMKECWDSEGLASERTTPRAFQKLGAALSMAMAFFNSSAA